MLTIYRQVLNSGSKALNVNGTSPVTFTYSPGAGSYAQVMSLVCLLKDEGTTTFSKFGAITALTNGVLIQWTIGGVVTTFTTMKDNADMSNSFPNNQHFGNGSVLSILSLVTPEGFGNSTNIFIGQCSFISPIVLQDTDTLSVVIQDNLSSIDVFQIGAMIET